VAIVAGVIEATVGTGLLRWLWGAPDQKEDRGAGEKRQDKLVRGLSTGWVAHLQGTPM